MNAVKLYSKKFDSREKLVSKLKEHHTMIEREKDVSDQKVMFLLSGTRDCLESFIQEYWVPHVLKSSSPVKEAQRLKSRIFPLTKV